MNFWVSVQWMDPNPRWNGKPRFVGFSAGSSLDLDEGDLPDMSHVLARGALSIYICNLAESSHMEVGDGRDLTTLEMITAKKLVGEIADACTAVGRDLAPLWRKIYAGLVGGGSMHVHRRE
jgi:hypothetical protein